MKKLFVTLFFFVLISFVMAQTPMTSNYTYEVRSSVDGSLAANQNVTIVLTVISGSETGTQVYTESHSVTTNGLGRAVVALGSGSSASPTWSSIMWSTSTAYFLKAEVSNSGYAIDGSTISLEIGSSANGNAVMGPNGRLIRLSPVATTGSYTTLTNRPTKVSDFTNDAGFITSSDVPTQVNADWEATSGVAKIENKPTLADVATSGSYTDLTDKPTNFLTSDSAVITNLQAASHSHANKAVLDEITAADTARWGQGQPQVQADWNQTTNTAADYIKNKPTLATVATTGNYSDLNNKPTFATVATTGSYNDLTNKPTIPTLPSDIAQTSVNNTFTGANDFTTGTTKVASASNVFTTMNGSDCELAVNYCALKAVFDSIQRQVGNLTTEIQNLRDTIKKLRAAEAPTFLYMATTPGMTTMDIVPTFNDGGATITEYEFCISTASNMSGKTCQTSATNHYVFTGLTPNSEYFVTVTATNMLGSTTSTIVSEITLPCANSSSHDVDITTEDLPYTFGTGVNDTTFLADTPVGTHTYTLHRTNVNGCDSTVTIHLTLTQACIATGSTHNLSITTDQLPYTFGSNDTIFPVGATTGTYYLHKTNACGKDSTITINLTVTTPVAFNCGEERVYDGDGNSYLTIQIGNQCWMRLNMRTTKYADGTDIAKGHGTASYYSSSTAYYYAPGWTDSEWSNVRHGLLYNWAAVMRDESSSGSNPSGVQGICPDGWHVPSDAEWTQLTDYVSSQGDYVCGSDATNIAMALTGTFANNNDTTKFAHMWNASAVTCAAGNTGETRDATGFHAQTGGKFYYDTQLRNEAYGNNAYFWSSTLADADAAYYLQINNASPTVTRTSGPLGDAYSVRCLLNSSSTPPTPTCTPTFSNFDIDIEPSQLPYSFGSDTTFEVGTVSGTYKLYRTNAAGCDSVITINLTVALAGCGIITDGDGNQYHTIIIGEQCWMRQNLKTTSYADGTPITEDPVPTTTEAHYDWIYYGRNDAPGNEAVRGLLYNWQAVMRGGSSSSANPSGVQGVCPTGWHVPSAAEWTQLTNYVGSISSYVCGGNSNNIAYAMADEGTYSTAGGIAWTVGPPCSGGSVEKNATGFSAMPQSININEYQVDRGYYNVGWGKEVRYWTTTEDPDDADSATYRGFLYDNPTVIDKYGYKGHLYAVRCLKDAEPAITTSLNITVPQADSSAVSLCSEASHSVTYTAHLTGASADSYTWSCSGGTPTPSSTATYTVAYSAAGDYTVTCTAAGETATFTNTILAGPSFTICESCDEGAVYIKDQGTCTSFSWKNSSDVEVSTSNSKLAVSTAAPAGTYTVTGITGGCSLTKTVTLSNEAPTTYCTVTSKNSNEDWKDADASTLKIEKVYDHQNNPYKVVQIGNQCWLKENMRATTSPITGTDILRSDNPNLYRSYSGKQARWYNNNESQNGKYGLLYNWNAAMDTCNTDLGETSVSLDASDGIRTIATPRRGICPAGWHLPSETEVNAMRTEVGVSTASSAHEGATGKLVTGCDWTRRTYDVPGLTAPVDYEYEYRNESGLSLIPAGHSTNTYSDIGWYAYLWTSTFDVASPADELRVVQWSIYGAHNYIHISSSTTTLANYCASVRCIRN